VKTYLLALPSLVLVAATLAPAQTQPANKVGVIQIQSAIVSTKDGQKAAADLETRLGPKRKELEKKQTDIKDLQDKLQRGGNAMTEAAKTELIRNIDQKTKSYQRDVEDADADAQQETRKLFDELMQKMMPVIDKYAQTNGFSVILDISSGGSPVLYAATASDITKEIIELYDKTAPALPASRPAATKPIAPTSAAPKPPAPAPAAPKKQP
jgi:outer membrane protein